MYHAPLALTAGCGRLSIPAKPLSDSPRANSLWKVTRMDTYLDALNQC